MATAIQKNGMKPLTNTINHVEDVNNLNNTNICKEEKDERLFDGQIQPYMDPPEQEPRELDIVINNVVCSFSVRCHLNLREIALNGSNVEYRRENGVRFKAILLFCNKIYLCNMFSDVLILNISICFNDLCLMYF